MKLVYRITLHISWVLSLLLAAWAVLFYLTTVAEIDDEVDDGLENRAEAVIRRSLAADGQPGREPSGAGFFSLSEVPADYAAARPQEVFTDERVYIPERDEKGPARVLRTIYRDADGRWMELTVMTPTLEKAALREAILGWVALLYFVLLLTVLAVGMVVLYRTLRPLYALLRWLDAYTVGTQNAPLDARTGITEFRRLNDAAQRYAARAESLFERQKQFIGNASHEMQTPLAVCRNRLEMLVDEGTLSEAQLGEIAKVQRTLDYLVRLNRSLLLLSKIENGQFPETEPVDVNALVHRTAGDLAEIYASRNMNLDVQEEAPLTVVMNPSLAASLVSNLLKNAFVHGDAGGRIGVTIAFQKLCISNDGAQGPLDGAHIFDRFYQGTRKEGSTGLGLSLVDAVCRLYGLRIEYTYVNKRHCFTVHFSG